MTVTHFSLFFQRPSARKEHPETIARYIYIYICIHVCIYIYIYIYIRHRAARHARAGLIHCLGEPMLCSLMSCNFHCFKGPHSLTTVLLAFLVAPFWHTFCIIFSDLIVNNDWYQKVSKCESQNIKNYHTNLKPILKTHPQSRPAKRLCLEGVKPLKLMTVIQFSLFFQRPRARTRHPKWEPKCRLRELKNHKKAAKTNTHKSTALQKLGQ